MAAKSDILQRRQCAKALDSSARIDNSNFTHNCIVLRMFQRENFAVTHVFRIREVKSCIQFDNTCL